MRTPCFVCLLVPAMILTGAGVLASAAGPVSQAWAVRIDGPTNTPLQAGGMDVGPSGDVFLAGSFRSGGYYIRDILITRRSSSGALVWERRYEPPEGPSANEGVSAIVARGTSVYVAGSIIVTNDGNADFLTLKYSDAGQLQWAARLNGLGRNNDTPTGIAVDAQGNVLVVGDSVGTNANLDIVVLKYGPTGNLLWTYSYDGPSHYYDRSLGIRVDPSGNIYVAGTSLNTGGAYSVVTLKLDPDGHELWTAQQTSADPSGLTGNGFDIDSAANVVVLGSERYYCVTWKYDANGNRQWLARYRAEEFASMPAYDIRFDGSGNIIAAANLQGSRTDAVLVKYAADGQQLWATRISPPVGFYSYFNALDVDSDGNAYVNMSPGFDVLTVKVSPEGAQLWSVTYNSQGSYTDYGQSLEVTPAGDIFISGNSFSFSENFISLVKYTQQPVTGVATATVVPALQVVEPGADVVFTAATTGPGPIHFQWRKNGRPIPNATDSTVSLTNVQVGHRGDYSVIVSNEAGITVSPEARLSVRVPPEVVVAPSQTLGYVGTDTTFAAAVSGNDFATFQWRHNGTNIPGATNETLRLLNLNAEASGMYDVVVTTFGGSTTSSAAGLTISRAVELINKTPHRSSLASYDYSPQLAVLPNGETFIAARSNHLLGASITLHKHAPDGHLLWTTAFESAEFPNAEPFGLALDGAGNIYIAGLSEQLYMNASAVLKYNPDGELLWSRFLTDTNRWPGVPAFAVDPQGNSVIAGLATGVTVNRYNPAGDLQWSFLDPSPDNDTIALAVSASGDTYLGTTIRAGAGNETRLRKFDSTGAIAWTIPSAEGEFNRLGMLAVDAAGYLIVAGTGGLEENGPMFVQKYSADGQKLWETRVGSSWREIANICALAVGPGNEITVLNRSDDDYDPGEESGLTRIGPDGQLRYRIGTRELFVSTPQHLALDNFGNAYITGWGARIGSSLDVATAKYDAYGSRHWLVYYNGPEASWQSGIAVSADAAGDIRVLATESTWPDSSELYNLLHFRQRDPASTFRLQLITDAAGIFHLGVLTQEPFRLQASADLQNWDLLTEAETQQLLQPALTPLPIHPNGSTVSFSQIKA